MTARQLVVFHFSAEVAVAKELNYGLRDSGMAGKALMGCRNILEAGCKTLNLFPELPAALLSPTLSAAACSGPPAMNSRAKAQCGWKTNRRTDGASSTGCFTLLQLVCGDRHPKQPFKLPFKPQQQRRTV